ncbi:sugar transferase [Parablautia intestinalis]|uniref:sugar transferase n=1 Tax=Parablautia intestinalis TaxID=2320100 RepID=UPI00256F4B2D|nr:sugar transferase [Parablautia intestinalis]
MAMHITNLYGMNPMGTQIIAQQNVVKIARELGFIEMGLYHYPVECDTQGELRKRLDGITSAVGDGDLVIVQLPSWNLTAYDKALLDVLRLHKDIKIAVFIHDVITMMFEGAPQERLLEIIEVYNMADLVIVPSEPMLNFLCQKGLTVEKVLIQSMWDLPFEEELKTPEFQRRIFFSGNPKRFGFVSSWHYDVPLHLYTYEDYKVEGQNIHYGGWKNTTELLLEYSSGGFGLIWEQTAPASYYKYHQPHKLSTYLAAGIPVIVQKGLAREQAIIDYGLGFSVNSTQEAADIVKNITEDEYQTLVENIKNISFLIRGGFFTKKLLIDTVNYLLLS